MAATSKTIKKRTVKRKVRGTTSSPCTTPREATALTNLDELFKSLSEGVEQPKRTTEGFFQSFQVLPWKDQDNPHVFALGYDGRMYHYDWEHAAWVQAPNRMIPDVE